MCYTDTWYTCIIESTNARCLATCQSKKRGKGRESRHTLGIFFGCYTYTYIHMYIHICIDAYAIHNVTYYLSNNYYRCGTNPHVFTLFEQIVARCVHIHICMHICNVYNDPYSLLKEQIHFYVKTGINAAQITAENVAYFKKFPFFLICNFYIYFTTSVIIY